MATAEHYRAYTPKPFTRVERDSTTILFGTGNGNGNGNGRRGPSP